MVVAKLDEKGRCCGKKPLRYTREPHYFCPRCDRAYSVETGEQIANWAWNADGTERQTTTHKGE